jgi:hypothetical protein
MSERLILRQIQLRCCHLSLISVPGKTKPAARGRRLSESKADSRGDCRYVTLIRIVAALQGWTIVVGFSVA